MLGYYENISVENGERHEWMSQRGPFNISTFARFQNGMAPFLKYDIVSVRSDHLYHRKNGVTYLCQTFLK